MGAPVGNADEVLADLATRRGRDLIAYAALYTGNLSSAEDLVHDALIKVFGRMRAGYTPDVAEAYVRRAIVNLYVDSFRRRQLWRSRAHLLAPDPPPPADPADALDVRAGLATLAPQERACVVLRFYADLTVPEIAAELGLNDGTVKRYLSNAMHKLQARLGVIDSHVDGVAVLPAEGKK